MTKRLFHLLSGKDRKAIENAGITWGDLMKKYRQPPWCLYPQALEGVCGCWSLVGGKVTGETYCVDCDCHKDSSNAWAA